MTNMEKEILLLISRVRCVTESQFRKIYGDQKRYNKKNFKKTLRKMCSEYTLKKYPCDVYYYNYKDLSYVYYLNGSKLFKGDDLIKALVGSELVVRINTAGCDVKRFYRNVSVDDVKYDLFIEYTDQFGNIKQVLVDVDLNNEIDISKYENLSKKIDKSTIPFFKVPNVLVVTPDNLSELNDLERYDNEYSINFIDLGLNKLFNCI